MNKKLLKSFAAAAMSVLAIACAKEPVGPGEGAMVEATFSVDVPGVEVSTKGLSDAASVNELICQVFLKGAKDKNKHFVYTPVPELTQNVAVVGGKATVKFSLVKGQTYSFAFWAQTSETGYYNTDDLRSVTMNTDLVKANDPRMDAFFAIKDEARVTVSYSKKVSLKRALAQVNFGTKKYSGRSDELKAQKSYVTLTGVPNVFHPFMSGDSFACEGSETVKFNENEVISDETLSVNDAEYSYLASVYVFALNPNKTITDATAVVTLSNGKTTTIKAPNAPVKRNFKTNILGDLLTVDAMWNVDIAPEFDGGDTYDSVAANLEAGKEVTLSEDYSASSKNGVVIPMHVTSSLDLNGYTFKNTVGTALEVRGSLTINGQGNVVCGGGNGANAAVFVQDGGKVIINEGYYYAEKDANGNGNSCIYVQAGNPTGNTINVNGENKPLYYGGGVVEINGGVFESDGNQYVLNQHDYIENDCCFIVKGGIFVGFNPADVNECHGKVTSFVADGYRSVKTEYEGKEAWKVEEIPAVTTHEDFNSAITSASAGVSATIKLASNMTAVLDNGIANEGDKSRNITFVGDGTQTFDVITKATNAEGGMLNYQRGSSFTFKNMSIKAGEGNFDGVVCDELVYENCTITGKLTLYGKATFVNCVFDNTMANQYSIWTWGGTDVKFDKCTFNTNGKAILLYGQATEAKPTNLIVTNCTLNDRKNGAAGKAAIEIGNDYNATYNLTISDCVINGFAEGKNTGSKTWANKNSMDAAHLSVTIDRVKIQ